MSDTGIQFDKAEVEGGQAQPGACKACGEKLVDSYWAVNGHAACGRCRDRFVSARESGSGLARFVKAFVFGAAGGIAGALVWFLVAHFLNFQAGIVAILVGFLVGGGVRMGSGRRGGWLYQALAIGLTYFAVAVGYFPDVLAELRTGPDAPSGIALYVFAIFVSVIAPALSGIMGVIITLIALYEAWKMNKRQPLAITGPHRLAAPGLAPPPLPASPGV